MESYRLRPLICSVIAPCIWQGARGLDSACPCGKLPPLTSYLASQGTRCLAGRRGLDSPGGIGRLRFGGARILRPVHGVRMKAVLAKGAQGLGSVGAAAGARRHGRAPSCTANRRFLRQRLQYQVFLAIRTNCKHFCSFLGPYINSCGVLTQRLRLGPCRTRPNSTSIALCSDQPFDQLLEQLFDQLFGRPRDHLLYQLSDTSAV